MIYLGTATRRDPVYIKPEGCGSLLLCPIRNHDDSVNVQVALLEGGLPLMEPRAPKAARISNC